MENQLEKTQSNLHGLILYETQIYYEIHSSANNITKIK